MIQPTEITKQVKYVIFDFDGTLADSFDTVLQIAKADFEGISEADFALLKEEGIQGLMKKKKVPLRKLPGFVLEMTSRIKERNDIRLFPEIPALIRQLNKNYRIGIVSSNNENNIRKTLTENGINDHFDFIFSDSSIFGKHKVLERMCNKHKLKSSEVLYVGDEDRDIIAAQRVKIKNIAVTWGFNSETRLRNVNPDHIVNSPLEILNITV